MDGARVLVERRSRPAVRAYRVVMRWDALFADLERQLAAASARERALEVADLTRAERATVALADRLRAGLGSPVAVTVRTGTTVRGDLVDVGAAWVLLADGTREHLVPHTAVVAVTGPAHDVAPPPGAVVRGLGLGHVLRAVARDRRVVDALTLAGTVRGRVDVVGADHLELAGVVEDTGRPSGARSLVTFAGLDVLTGT